MVIDTMEIEPNIFLLVSDAIIPEGADRDFIDWAEANGCYTPTASEIEEDHDGHYTVKVMKEPAE